MADITSTAARVAVIFPAKAIIFDAEAAVALEAGQPAYINSNGKAALADASNAATLVTPGVVLNKAGAGQGVSILKEGHVAGFDLSGLAYGAKVYVSDTAGALADAAGSTSLVMGSVVPIAQVGGPVKALYVEADWS